MIARPPTLRERIDEVEARVAQRQARVQVRWREAQHATRTLVRVHRTLPMVAAGAAVLAGLLLLRRSPPPAKAGAVPGGLLGVLVGAGLTLIAPRYSALYSFAWQLLSRRIASARRGPARTG